MLCLVLDWCVLCVVCCVFRDDRCSLLVAWFVCLWLSVNGCSVFVVFLLVVVLLVACYGLD